MGYRCVPAIAILLSGAAALAGKDVPVAELPKAVVEAIQKRFPGAELLKAEWEEADDDAPAHYEVDIRHDGKKYEVEITKEGKILDIDKDD